MYGGRFSKTDVDEMDPDELIRFSRKLADQKKAEKEAHEKALKTAKAAAKRRR